MEEVKFDLTASRAFLAKEINRLIETNHQAATTKADQTAEGRTPFVVVCMDERNVLTEEALGLKPSEIIRFASGGGKIAAEDFLRLHAPLLADGGRGAAIYLCTHWVKDEPENGCAAFKCDEPEQIKYFTELRQALAVELPEAWIHALAYDTANDALYGIELDPRDESFVTLVKESGRPLATPREVHAHAGFGVYVGDCYRAWVSEYNRYFHVSAGAPSLRSDLDISLGVMLHHSKVDLTDKPVMILLDCPTDKADVAVIKRHRQAALTVKDFLSSPEASRLKESGRLELIELETDPTTLRGRILTALDQTAEEAVSI